MHGDGQDTSLPNSRSASPSAPRKRAFEYSPDHDRDESERISKAYRICEEDDGDNYDNYVVNDEDDDDVEQPRDGTYAATQTPSPPTSPAFPQPAMSQTYPSPYQDPRPSFSSQLYTPPPYQEPYKNVMASLRTQSFAQSAAQFPWLAQYQHAAWMNAAAENGVNPASLPVTPSLHFD